MFVAYKTTLINLRSCPLYIKWFFLLNSTFLKSLAASINSRICPNVDPQNTQIFLSYQNEDFTITFVEFLNVWTVISERFVLINYTTYFLYTQMLAILLHQSSDVLQKSKTSHMPLVLIRGRKCQKKYMSFSDNLWKTIWQFLHNLWKIIWRLLYIQVRLIPHLDLALN